MSDVTDQVTWESDQPAVAAASASPGMQGVVAAVGAAGAVVQIRASFMGVESSPAVITVFPAVCYSRLQISPAALALCPGDAVTFAATGSLLDGRTVDATARAMWSSSAPAVASIDPATGRATAVASGTSTITARVASAAAPGASLAATATLTVVPATPSALSVSPAGVELAPGATQRFVATLLDSCGHARTLDSADATWTSLAPAVASVDTAGLATALAPGSTTIRVDGPAGLHAEAALSVVAP
jgi:uncharacterized protein YjdB